MGWSENPSKPFSPSCRTCRCFSASCCRNFSASHFPQTSNHTDSCQCRAPAALRCRRILRRFPHRQGAVRRYCVLSAQSLRQQQRRRPPRPTFPSPAASSCRFPSAHRANSRRPMRPAAPFPACADSPAARRSARAGARSPQAPALCRQAAWNSPRRQRSPPSPTTRNRSRRSAPKLCPARPLAPFSVPLPASHDSARRRHWSCPRCPPRRYCPRVPHFVQRALLPPFE